MVLLSVLLACTGGSGDRGADRWLPHLETLSLAQDLAERGMDRNPVDVQPHDWMQTVWVYSLLRLSDVTGDEAAARYAATWMTDWLPEVQALVADGDTPFVSSDSLSPAIIAARLDDPALQPIIDAADAYLDTAPRSADGAIEHWTDAAPFGVPDQVWIDSQFMIGQYMLARYVATGDPGWADRWVEQYDLVSRLCRDPADQLYRHAWDDAAGENIPAEAVYWNRGNSWVLTTGVDGLIVLGDAAPDWLADAVEAHARAVADAQDGSGLWPTVLSPPGGPDPDNYLETSGSALLAAAIARGTTAGVLPADLQAVVAPAVVGVEGMIEEGDDGPVVTGTSFGTNPGSYEDYLAVGQVDDLLLGIGAVILLLADADGLPDTTLDDRRAP
ncbi:MAG: hypothetical protein D6798_06275 [Deltaproteobacteria bacterium]|nr:MAG: hypothetical protein D6798_06275 [Deltaproteobacteria bacterium]